MHMPRVTVYEAIVKQAKAIPGMRSYAANKGDAIVVEVQYQSSRCFRVLVAEVLHSQRSKIW